MGRTHGVHAEPTTFGVKMALWYTEMQRNLQRFKQVREEIEVGKMSGAVGTFANIPPEIESYVCKHLGIGTAPVSTQTLQRDRHAYYIATLALIATSLEKFAVEIRNLQKPKREKLKKHLQKAKKVHLQCLINEIQLVLKISQVFQESFVVILLQLMRMCHYGMKEIFLILLLSVLCYQMLQ